MTPSSQSALSTDLGKAGAVTVPPIEVTVNSVEIVPADGLRVKEFAIESPQASPYGQDHQLVFAGWIIPAEGVSVTGVEVRDRGRIVKQARTNVPRADVLAARGQAGSDGTDRIGFHFEIGTLGLGKRASLKLCALCVQDTGGSESTVVLCDLELTKVSRLHMDTSYQPVQITAIGRSGTTLLMEVLGRHPEVLTTNFYPYELRQAAYWMHFLRVATAPADFEYSAHPDVFDTKMHHIGHNPYNHPEYINQYLRPEAAKRYYTADTFHAVATMCMERIDAYYRFIAQQEEKPRARYFAEKFLPGTMQNICSDLYKARKEVILTRDFRDMLCSARSFNAKRNTMSFGRDKVNDEFEWVDRISRLGARNLYHAWLERNGSALHVRYEDLVSQPAEQLVRIFAYLEVESSGELIDEIVATAFALQPSRAVHRTSASAAASIGRWKLEMSHELQKHCALKLGYALAAFGYS